MFSAAKTETQGKIDQDLVSKLSLTAFDKMDFDSGKHRITDK